MIESISTVTARTPQGPHRVNSVALVTIGWKMSPETCREISRLGRASAS
jgi:hypothetical protein